MPKAPRSGGGKVEIEMESSARHYSSSTALLVVVGPRGEDQGKHEANAGAAGGGQGGQSERKTKIEAA